MALKNRPPGAQGPPPEAVEVQLGEIVCQERLGGQLKYYERRAA